MNSTVSVIEFLENLYGASECTCGDDIDDKCLACRVAHAINEIGEIATQEAREFGYHESWMNP